jgi:hypothetical protein
VPSPTTRSARAAVAVALLSGISLLVGCGPPPTGTVSGTVTVGGQTVQNGLITFVPEKGESCSAAILDGKYTTGPIPAGPCKVAVINRPANPSAGGNEVAGGGDVLPTAKPSKGKTKEVTVPQKYSDPTGSGLSHTVTAGASTKDFDIPPEGK